MHIFVLDHHPLMSEMLVMLLHRIHAQAHVVTAHTFKQLNALIDKYEEADVVIMEPQSIGCLGPLSVAHIAERLPHSKIIVITDANLDETNNRYLQNGAHHVISKKDKINKITTTLQEILHPQSLNVNSSLIKVDILKISKRHRQLINMLGQGYSNSQIAERLDISEHTVKVHFYRLYKILGVSSRLQALNLAKSNGSLLDPMNA